MALNLFEHLREELLRCLSISQDITLPNCDYAAHEQNDAVCVQVTVLVLVQNLMVHSGDGALDKGLIA